MAILRVFVLLAFASLCILSQAAKGSKDCKVCEDVLTAALEGLSASDKKTLETTEAAIDAYCGQNEISQTHKKMCYYISPIKREISQPSKNGVPVDRICKRLKKKSAEICAVTEKVKVSSMILRMMSTE